ncbi:MAG: hypothetical protein RL011_2275, partial [Pseudomonadota bacterium]
MKFIVRFLLPLSLLLGTLIYLSAPVIDQLMTRWFTRDLDIRARLIANVLEETLAVLLVDGSPSNRQKITKILTKVTQDERLLAIAICDQSNTFLYKTDLFPSNLQCPPKSLGGVRKGEIHRLPTGDVHMAAISVVVDPPQSSDSPPSGEPKHYDVALVHDLSYAAKRSDDTKTYAYLLFLGLGLMISGLTVIVARWSRASWVKSVRQLVGGFRGDMSSNQGLKGNRDFLPILRDLKGLVRDLEATSRSNADYGNTWNPTALRSILKEKLSGDEIIVISNRQPYIHNKIDDKIVIQSPASGLVTALEPIMKACSGVWIAHGNGSADAEVVDSDSRIPVPPRKPQYDLHRLWLTAEEERGYYYGFSNEGIWPLCHIAHTRPVFRHSDWQQYVAVNKKFAQAVIKDSKSDDPVILVQDYHFALVPRLLREKLPKATIITFWHIPWPNPESFGICPWRQEILQGLLGSSI